MKYKVSKRFNHKKFRRSMETTFRKLFEANGVMSGILKDLPDTKIAETIKRFGKKNDKKVEQYQELISNAEIDNCSVDEKGNIIRDEHKQLVYSKDGIKARNKAQKEAIDSKVTIEPCFTSDVPASLDEDQIESLKGFVIKPDFARVQEEVKQPELSIAE